MLEWKLTRQKSWALGRGWPDWMSDPGGLCVCFRSYLESSKVEVLWVLPGSLVCLIRVLLGTDRLESDPSSTRYRLLGVRPEIFVCPTRVLLGTDLRTLTKNVTYQIFNFIRLFFWNFPFLDFLWYFHSPWVIFSSFVCPIRLFKHVQRLRTIWL